MTPDFTIEGLINLVATLGLYAFIWILHRDSVKLRAELTKQFAELRAETKEGLTGLRAEIRTETDP